MCLYLPIGTIYVPVSLNLYTGSAEKINNKLDGSLPANPVNDRRIANAVRLESTFCLPSNQQLFKNI